MRKGGAIFEKIRETMLQRALCSAGWLGWPKKRFPESESGAAVVLQRGAGIKAFPMEREIDEIAQTLTNKMFGICSNSNDSMTS